MHQQQQRQPSLLQAAATPTRCLTGSSISPVSISFPARREKHLLQLLQQQELQHRFAQKCIHLQSIFRRREPLALAEANLRIPCATKTGIPFTAYRASREYCCTDRQYPSLLRSDATGDFFDDELLCQEVSGEAAAILATPRGSVILEPSSSHFLVSEKNAPAVFKDEEKYRSRKIAITGVPLSRSQCKTRIIRSREEGSSDFSRIQPFSYHNQNFSANQFPHTPLKRVGSRTGPLTAKHSVHKCVATTARTPTAARTPAAAKSTSALTEAEQDPPLLLNRDECCLASTSCCWNANLFSDVLQTPVSFSLESPRVPSFCEDWKFRFTGKRARSTSPVYADPSTAAAEANTVAAPFVNRPVVFLEDLAAVPPTPPSFLTSKALTSEEDEVVKPTSSAAAGAVVAAGASAAAASTFSESTIPYEEKADHLRCHEEEILRQMAGTLARKFTQISLSCRHAIDNEIDFQCKNNFRKQTSHFTIPSGSCWEGNCRALTAAARVTACESGTPADADEAAKNFAAAASAADWACSAATEASNSAATPRDRSGLFDIIEANTESLPSWLSSGASEAASSQRMDLHKLAKNNASNSLLYGLCRTPLFPEYYDDSDDLRCTVSSAAGLGRFYSSFSPLLSNFSKKYLSALASAASAEASQQHRSSQHNVAKANRLRTEYKLTSSTRELPVAEQQQLQQLQQLAQACKACRALYVIKREIEKTMCYLENSGNKWKKLDLRDTMQTIQHQMQQTQQHHQEISIQQQHPKQQQQQQQQMYEPLHSPHNSDGEKNQLEGKLKVGTCKDKVFESKERETQLLHQVSQLQQLLQQTQETLTLQQQQLLLAKDEAVQQKSAAEKIRIRMESALQREKDACSRQRKEKEAILLDLQQLQQLRQHEQQRYQPQQQLSHILQQEKPEKSKEKLCAELESVHLELTAAAAAEKAELQEKLEEERQRREHAEELLQQLLSARLSTPSDEESDTGRSEREKLSKQLRKRQQLLQHHQQAENAALFKATLAAHLVDISPRVKEFDIQQQNKIDKSKNVIKERRAGLTAADSGERRQLQQDLAAAAADVILRKRKKAEKSLKSEDFSKR